jgi:hypothetical protein
MKKLFVVLAAMVMTLSASAFDFDGINLNASVNKISSAIAKRGYVYDDKSDAFTGLCRGTQIYMSMNWKDVKEAGKLGQLIVDVPMKEENAFTVVSKMLNVIYHVAEGHKANVYSVDEDGTTLEVHKSDKGVRLVYNTPYYKK